MTVRLQQFGHRASRYEQPNPKWVCGWAAEGNPCRLGPDGKGRCPAAGQALCEPRRDGDRWLCARPELYGGVCEDGPRPDGSCCRPRPEQPLCQPRLSWRARRGRLSASCVAVTIGLLALALQSDWGYPFISPGPLMSAHAVVETAAPAALLRFESSGEIACVAFSPDGSRLVAGARDGSLRIWDAARGGASIVPLVGHTAAVDAAQFSSDGNRVVSAGTDGSIILWDAARGGRLRDVRVAGSAVLANAISSNGRLAASGSADGAIVVIDTSNGEEQWRHAGVGDAVATIAFSPDGGRLAAGAEDGITRVWDAETGDLVDTLRQEHAVVALAFSQDGERLASASVDRVIRVWQVGAGVELQTISHVRSTVHAMAFAQDGSRLASGTNHGTIVLIDPGSGQERLSVPGHDGPVRAVTFAPDGRRVASGSSDGRIKLWKAATGEDGWPAWRAPPRKVHCHFCHVKAEGTGGILQPVKDSACVSCHIAEAHHPSRSADTGQSMMLKERLGSVQMASGCTSCHSEHHGREEQPRRVPDSTCTECHEALAVHRGISTDDHVPGDPLPRIDPPIAIPVADTVTALADGHPEFDAVAADAIDVATIRFGHRKHMDPETGQMQKRLTDWVTTLKEERPEYEIPVKHLENGQLRLSCSACHAPDATGQHMKPIRFDLHCRHCHERPFTSIVDAKDMVDGEHAIRFPHGSSIKTFLPAEAFELAGSLKVIAGERKRRGGTKPNRWAKLNIEPDSTPSARMPIVLEYLREEAANRCSKCHSDPDADTKIDPVDIVDPMIPERWFTRASFNHDAHRFVACLDCHAQAGPDAPARDWTHAIDPPSMLEELRWTKRTKDIMLPSIETCRECHAPRSTAGESAVRHDCVLCHEYHVPAVTAVLGGAVLARPVTETAVPPPPGPDQPRPPAEE
ncbi:MAG: hypothetical protein HKO59_07900 [Phycisphaerales bacterium]|nr:hypothetical protein [Phycisphaerales bacterium]NNM25896.1 hypothetical protein [Phycisphaerales bacterium]